MAQLGKIVGISAGALALTVLGLLASSYLAKFESKRTVLIDAPADTVWTQLIDTGNYASWSPNLQFISSEPISSKGQRLHIANGDFEFTPQVTEFVPHKELGWIGHLWGPLVADGHHYFLLETTPTGQTQLTQGERFTGILAPLTPLLLNQNRDFDVFNQAFKDYVEQQ